jgi:hypothetical protein
MQSLQSLVIGNFLWPGGRRGRASYRDSRFSGCSVPILFGPVEISRLNLKLWLPTGVDVSVQANGIVLHEQHVYSDYRM